MSFTGDYREFRIFAASPRDMAAERSLVSKVVTTLQPLAEHLGLIAKAVDWRVAVPDMGRPQQIIFDQLKPATWDVFIGILWHTFGTSTGAIDPQRGLRYRSGTEEEFWTAYRFWQQYRRPRICIYRCTRPVSLDSIDFEEAQRVREFISECENAAGEHPGLIQAFDTPETFEKTLLNHLQRLLLATETRPQPPASMLWSPVALETMLLLAKNGAATFDELVDQGIVADELLQALGELRQQDLILLTEKTVHLAESGRKVVETLRRRLLAGGFTNDDVR